MYVAIIKSLDDDAYGKDLSGVAVPMPLNSVHLVSIGDLGFYKHHSDVFQIVNEGIIDPAVYTTDPAGNKVLNGGGATEGIPQGRQTITASDAGSAWQKCPGIVVFTSTLTSGTATTVLLEFKTELDVVTTAATIVNDVVAQALHTAFDARNAYLFRFRRSSGTGVVTILY